MIVPGSLTHCWCHWADTPFMFQGSHWSWLYWCTQSSFVASSTLNRRIFFFFKSHFFFSSFFFFLLLFTRQIMHLHNLIWRTRSPDWVTDREAVGTSSGSFVCLIVSVQSASLCPAASLICFFCMIIGLYESDTEWGPKCLCRTNTETKRDAGDVVI